ncbi:MAG TPA: hypothetical protein VK509_21640, partial [Polyangiales bacterium]|nr:hypothetical protein [Polyangiales bacterium]
MKASRDPLRWSELGSDAPPTLATGIRALRATTDGSDAMVAALGQRLAPQLATPTAAGTATALSPWLKLAGALLISGALGLYAFARSPQREQDHEQAPERPARSEPAARAALPSSPAAEPQPSAAPLVPPAGSSSAEQPG